MAERWVDYHGYKVSDMGNINGKDGEPLKVTLTRYGYKTVYISTKELKKMCSVHSLVCECFVGKKPEGLITRHLNGVKTDNRLENLKYGTRSENELDKIAHGSALIGRKHFNCKLSNEQCEYIRNRYVNRSQKHGSVVIAKELGVHPTTVEKIAKGSRRKDYGEQYA